MGKYCTDCVQCADCIYCRPKNMVKVKIATQYYLNMSMEKFMSTRSKYDMRYKVLVWNFATEIQYHKCLFSNRDCPTCRHRLLFLNKTVFV
jgi:hypothetical protein